MANPLCPDPGDVSMPPAWEDVERLSLHYPAVRSALTMVRVDALTREQALIAMVFGLARVLHRMEAATLERLERQAHPAFTGIARGDLPKGPERWTCKKCGEARRRSECLSCGNQEPLTDEPRTSGLVW